MTANNVGAQRKVGHGRDENDESGITSQRVK